MKKHIIALALLAAFTGMSPTHGMKKKLPPVKQNNKHGDWVITIPDKTLLKIMFPCLSLWLQYDLGFLDINNPKLVVALAGSCPATPVILNTPSKKVWFDNGPDDPEGIEDVFTAHWYEEEFDPSKLNTFLEIIKQLRKKVPNCRIIIRHSYNENFYDYETITKSMTKICRACGNNLFELQITDRIVYEQLKEKWEKVIVRKYI